MKISTNSGNNMTPPPPPPVGGNKMPPPPMGNNTTPPPPMGGNTVPTPPSGNNLGNTPPPPMNSGNTTPSRVGVNIGGTNKNSISLQKGQKIDLTKTNPGLTKIMIGLGWDTNKYDGQADFDLDASAFLLGAQGKALADSDFIFYNNPKGRNDCVVHQGDNITGEGEGDDEQILVDFSKVPPEIDKIAITVTIYDYENRKQSFGQISNAFVRVVDNNTNQELIRYDLGEDFSIETAIIVCEIYRNNGEWKFSAIGSGFSGGLGALCANYGLQAN